MDKISVIDLFAGPGGLGEGFNAYKDGASGDRPFRTAISIEKDRSAFRTLRFRAFLRLIREANAISEIDLSALDPTSGTAEVDLFSGFDPTGIIHRCWEQAQKETLCAELGGSSDDRQQIDSALTGVNGQNAILIGGPPCQAYSLVGRSRNRGIAGYRAEEDLRHFLYREYVEILQRVRPLIFVMENVKGILSAKIERAEVFNWIVGDLRTAGYELLPLAPSGKSKGGTGGADFDPYDFVVRAEAFGIPQARHRVIVLGVRSDLIQRIAEGPLKPAEIVQQHFRPHSAPVPVGSVLSGLPRLPSRLSRRSRGDCTWAAAVKSQAKKIAATDLERFLSGPNEVQSFLQILRSSMAAIDGVENGRSGDYRYAQPIPKELCTWLDDSSNDRLYNHEARSHMASDLGRYLYASIYAQVTGTSPKAANFPRQLAPDHANWRSGKFADRFRAQVADSPATTVTSHISKDGHYFIHPDPAQCRSFTVREAARIQTFPDNYIFFGNRTQQYVQVGNAVPPFLALQIAGVVAGLLRTVSDV